MAAVGKFKILVLCTGNSARSQIAEAFLKKYGSERFDVRSAGTEPKGVNPLTVRVMNEIGIDLSDARSKHLNEFLGVWPAQIVLIVCNDADKACPAVWPGVLERLVWPFEDPARATGSEEERLEVFRRVRDEISGKIKSWVAALPRDYMPGTKLAAKSS